MEEKSNNAIDLILKIVLTVRKFVTGNTTNNDIKTREHKKEIQM